MKYKKNASKLFSPLLYSIAKSVPPTPKVSKPVKRKGGNYNVAVSDETVMEIIRLRLNGAKTTELAKEYGVSLQVIRQWCGGINRGHLLTKVESEMYYGN
jgi:DNA invertase Pin-like site-specific DNA recombinase